MSSKVSSSGYVLLLLLAVSSCSPMRYSEFKGRDVRWQVATGSMADTSYAVPVYREWPERPYDVVGSVRFEDPRKYWDDGIIRRAAETARKRGGDAIIVRFGSVVPFSWLDSWTSRPTGYGQEITALVIKWTPEDVVRARRAQDERFLAEFRQKHAGITGNEQVLQLAINFLTESGVQPGSPEMQAKLSSLLTEVCGQGHTDLAGKWLFKGKVQNKSITSSESQSFVGVATVGLTGNRVTILSTAGSAEVNFSGTVDAGQISGTLGVGGGNSSLSVKCEGVAVNEKISFAFQKLTEGGTVQGTVTFQR